MEYTDYSNPSDNELLSDYELKEIWREAYFDNPCETELKEYVNALSDYLLGKDTFSDDEAEEIKLLFSRHPNNEDVCELMSFYLSDQSSTLRKEAELRSVEAALSNIYDAFPNNTQIACDLASVLSDLVSVQDVDTALETVERIKTLKMRFPREAEIKDSYKSAENDVKQKKKTLKYKKAVDIAEMNYANNPCEKTAKALASSLSNLSDVTVSEYDAEAIVSRIKDLLNTFTSCESIWISYANSLASLANCRRFEDAKETLRQLQELVNSENSTEEMIEIYAEALSSKTIWNDHDISEYVIELSRLNTLYPSSESIACSYASGLYCLAESYDIATNKSERVETIEKLHELATKYSGNKDIKEYYDEAVSSFKWEEDYYAEDNEENYGTDKKQLWGFEMEEKNFLDVCEKAGIHTYTGIIIDMCATDIGLINIDDFIEYCTLNGIKTVFMQYEFQEDESLSVEIIKAKLTRAFNNRLDNYPYSETSLPKHITKEFFASALSDTLEELDQDKTLNVDVEVENEDELIEIKAWAANNTGCRIYTIVYEKEDDEQEKPLSEKAVFSKYAGKIDARLEKLLQEARNQSQRIEKEIKDGILAEISKIIEDNRELIMTSTQKARNEFAEEIQLRYQEEKGCDWLTKKKVKSMVEYYYMNRKKTE